MILLCFTNSLLIKYACLDCFKSLIPIKNPTGSRFHGEIKNLVSKKSCVKILRFKHMDLLHSPLDIKDVF